MAVAGIFPALYLASEAIATDQYSYSTRTEAWLLVLEMVKSSPLLGFGPANYYWYTPLFPIRGWAVAFNSHSQYVDIIAQTGILGLFCFCWFAWEVWRLGFRLRNRVPAGFAQAYVYGALGGWIGTLASGILVDWFLPFAYNIALRGFRASVLVWFFIGGLASIEQMYRRELYGPEIEASTARRK
jgi:O-antigen ligase